MAIEFIIIGLFIFLAILCLQLFLTPKTISFSELNARHILYPSIPLKLWQGKLKKKEIMEIKNEIINLPFDEILTVVTFLEDTKTKEQKHLLKLLEEDPKLRLRLLNRRNLK